MKTTYFLIFLTIFLTISCAKDKKENPDKKCNEGFTYRKDWDSCIDINECKTNNGGCEQNCTNKIGAFECSCNEKFVLNDDGKTCSDVNDCKENSCRNNGKCIDKLDFFICECFKGYSGTNCEECAEGFELYNDKCLLKPNILEWGSKEYETDIAEDFVTDSKGNIFVIGYTYGEFDNNNNLGQEDFFLSKINKNFEIQWTKQFGSSETEQNTSIAIDNEDNLYIAGVTNGSYFGISSGNRDIALTKIDSNGNIIWKNQAGSSDDDVVFDIALDTNKNIYIVGYRYNEQQEEKLLFLRKFNNFGDEVWTKEEDIDGTEFSYHLAIDSENNIYIGTTTLGNLDDTENLGSADLLLIKYAANGNRLWDKQWGTDKYDDILNILISNNEIYVTGFINGHEKQFMGASGDIFLTKLDENGSIIFDKTWATENDKRGTDIIISPDNKNIYISGYTLGVNSDMVLKKIDNNGDLVFSKRWFSGNQMLVSLLFSNETLYALGVIYHSSDYNPFLLKFNF